MSGAIETDKVHHAGGGGKSPSVVQWLWRLTLTLEVGGSIPRSSIAKESVEPVECHRDRETDPAILHGTVLCERVRVGNMP